jgi:hypothetical protein
MSSTRQKLDKAEEELNKSGQGVVSVTYPEARFMENKKKRIVLSYNSQITATSTVPTCDTWRRRSWMAIPQTASRRRR